MIKPLLFLNKNNYRQNNKLFFDYISRYWNYIISYDHEEQSYFYEQILDLVNSGELCNDKIDHQEIAEQLYSCDLILILVDYSEVDSESDYGKVIGFALASYIYRTSVGYCKLDILCGSGGGSGSELLQKITDIIFSTGVTKITIDALKSAERFYLSRGFEILQKTAYFTRMEKNITGGSKKKRSIKSKNNKNKKISKKYKTKKQNRVI